MATSMSAQPTRVLCIAVNGVGIGHVVRCARLALSLRSAGHEVLLAIESTGESKISCLPVDWVRLPRLTYRSNRPDGYLACIKELLATFDPEVVVFDTHEPAHPLVQNLPELRYRRRIALSSLPTCEHLRGLSRRTDVELIALLHSVEEAEQIYGFDALTEVTASERVVFVGGPITRGEVLLNGLPFVPPPAERYALWVLGGGGRSRRLGRYGTSHGIDAPDRTQAPDYEWSAKHCSRRTKLHSRGAP